MIDQYCERTAAGLWGEPVNLVTNLSFLLAAHAALQLRRELDARGPGLPILIALTLGIGIGSSLFHAVATGWAKALDLAPIFAYQLVFLWVYLRCNLRAPFWLSAFVALALSIFSVSLLWAPQFLNGSILYIPTLLALFAIGIYHAWTSQPGRWLLLFASGIFAAALLFRSLDEWACPHVPMGTHFLWHLLNGLLLYLTMKVVILRAAHAKPGPTD